MPKIIKNLNKKILAEAKKLLLEQGVRDMSVRELAQRCGIAVGTVYNYYESKEILIAEIMMADWDSTVQKAKKGIAKAKSGVDGMEVIYNAIRSFFSVYNKVFDSFKKTLYVPAEYHKRLIEEIIELEKHNFEHFPCAMEPAPYKFLAENIMHAVTQGRMDFDELRPVLERIL